MSDELARPSTASSTRVARSESAQGAPTREWLRCAASPAYFIEQHVQIYDATERAWIRFGLWREQYDTLKVIERELWVVILKARQLGLTWLCLAFALWLMLFHGPVTILVFSRRDDEAIYLLSDERLRGMYARLPDFLRARAVVASNDHEFALSNGSIVRGFPTTAGDSYTASLVMVDEADLIDDFGRLMRSVKPTIDGGGRMVVLSRSNKSKPLSEFKNLYREAKAGRNGWQAIFLPWWVRPSRDAAWYAAQKADIEARTRALDDLHEQYPATDFEALAPAQKDKRLSAADIAKCSDERRAYAVDRLRGFPALPQLEIYVAPIKGHTYVIGADPAEGNPEHDASALEVLDADTGEEAAALATALEPSIFGAAIDAIGLVYNRATVLVERNNHGHAVIGWLRDHSKLKLLAGRDGKPGYLTDSRGKALLYAAAADALRDVAVQLHAGETITQLSHIEGATLRAPEGLHDDRAVAFALANTARGLAPATAKRVARRNFDKAARKSRRVAQNPQGISKQRSDEEIERLMA